MKILTAVSLIDNSYQHITAFTPLGKDGKLDYSRKLLLFVKATVIRVPSPATL